MTGVAFNFDATNAPTSAPLDPLPAGWYNVKIIETEAKQTAANDGQAYLKLTLEVLDGPFAGRKVFDQLNLWNNNPTTVEIAYKTMATIQHSIGLLRIEHTDQLLNIPLKAKVKLTPARTETNPDGTPGKHYEAKNDVRGYDAYNSNHEVVAAPAGGVAGAPIGQAPWAAPGAPASAPPQPQPAPFNAAPQPAAPAAQPAAPATPPGTPWQPPAGAAQPWATGAQPQPQPAAPAAPVAPPAAPPPAPVQVNPLDAAKAAGWQPHPSSPGWWYLGQEVLSEQDLSAKFAAPPPAPAPAAFTPPSAPAGAPQPASGAPGTQRPPWAT